MPELPQVEISFTSPTSLRMKDTFIIKSDSFVKLNLNSSPFKKLTSSYNKNIKTDISKDSRNDLDQTLENELSLTHTIQNKSIV